MNDATTIDPLPIQIAPADRLLTAAEFQKLADVPPEVEWFGNLSNRHTRRAYENAVKDFVRFAGIFRPEEFRTVTRAHLIAWRDELRRRGLGGATIRHRLASLASLFEYLCEKNAVTHNPVKGVERPRTECGEGKTPRSATIRRATCSPRPTRTPRASATAPSCRRCCSTRCGARSCAS
jgi:integrase/recombinase XerD